MSEIQIREGNNIYEKGKPLTMLGVIIDGTVTVELHGETLTLSKEDVIGLLDLSTGIHSYTYMASTDVVVDSYPYKPSSGLHNVFNSEDSFKKIFVASAAKQFFAISGICNLYSYTCDSLYSALMQYHRDYTMLCKQYQLPAKQLPGLEDAMPLVLENKPDSYVGAYYNDIQVMCKDNRYTNFFDKTGFITGFLQRASVDMHNLLNTCDEMEAYMAQHSELLMNEDHIDFLDLYTSLLSHAAQKRENTDALVSAISKMFIRTKNVSSISAELYNRRLLSYRQLSADLEKLSAKQDEDISEHKKSICEKLKYSVTTLLDFAKMESEFRNQFIENINQYKQVVDKTSNSAELAALRNELTNSFFLLYKEIFFMSIKQETLPAIVKMFLYFGYVDEDLCGIENAIDLYTLLPTYRSDQENNIYLFYDWLKLIYEGKKQPRCDEFDQDYPAYIQARIQDGTLEKSEGEILLHDNHQKVIFELDNMFTSAVKITYGRLHTFCPILSEHDFIKTPEEILVAPNKLKEAFLAITAIDFSAYCREVMFADPLLPNGRELVQREILPDVILLPNIGTRAALWQEIEGRNRSTPSCMLFPVFCLTDIHLLVIRLTGEFRWEMCKRMQGSRWNDVSNKSLTSEYFDYLQFYKKNKELSPEAKEKCHQQLLRVKNRFRESFVLDYVAWVTYESKGSPRMNKVTRKIFMTYCPFSKQYREVLKRNPFYTDMLMKYDNQKNKELTRMNSVAYRIGRNSGAVVPLEIEQQIEYLKK